MIKSFLLILLFTQSYCLLGQTEDLNWLLNDSMNITFDTAPPTLHITQSRNIAPQGICISHSAANILFYKGKGYKFYDADNNQIFTLDASETPKCIRHPESFESFALYYVKRITNRQRELYRRIVSFPPPLYKAQIDNPVLIRSFTSTGNFPPYASNFTIAPNSEGDKQWLVFAATNALSAQLIGKAGVEKTVNTTYTFPPDIDLLIRLSPDLSSVYILTGQHLYVANFNASTGEISHLRILLSELNYAQEFLELSSNGQYLYLRSGEKTNNLQRYRTDQNANQELFLKSKEILDLVYNGRWQDVQIGHDGNIYMSTNPGGYIEIIENPNQPLGECRYKEKEIQLPTTNFSLPHFLIYRPSFVLENRCESLTIRCTYQGVLPKSVVWDFGDGSTSSDLHPTHTYLQSGRYTIKMTTQNKSNRRDTFTQEIEVRNSLKPLNIIFDNE